MDDSKLWLMLQHGWEVMVGILSATVSYMFYKKKKKEEYLQSINSTLQSHSLDNSIFKVELRELKEDIQNLREDLRDIKDWLLGPKKGKK